jgi:hypothetical protein
VTRPVRFRPLAAVTAREVWLSAIFGVILLWQLFLPGFIGLADNRDFAKVAGRLCLGRPDAEADVYVYFNPDYVREQRFCWDSGIPSSELWLARVASAAQQRFRNPARFDLRWLAAVHAILLLAAWALMLQAIRPLSGLRWWIAAAMSLWILMDVGFLSYLNSFYTDTAALLGAMILLPSALSILVSQKARAWHITAFAAGAFLLVSSKGQHAILAPALAAFLVWASRTATSVHRWLAAGCSAFLLVAMAWTLVQTPYWYKAQARFSLVFHKLLPASPTPSRDVEELGLEQQDLAYTGQHAFLPSSPAFDAVWLERFSRRGSFGSVARFWLRHPLRALATLKRDLDIEAIHRRADNLSNYQKSAGQPPGTLTNRLGTWSSLRSGLFALWPLHIALWYALVILFAPVLGFRARTPLARASAWTSVFAAVLGLAEFSVVSLADAVETDRHLILFHLLTDFTMLMALVDAIAPREPAPARPSWSPLPR